MCNDKSAGNALVDLQVWMLQIFSCLRHRSNAHLEYFDDSVVFDSASGLPSIAVVAEVVP